MSQILRLKAYLSLLGHSLRGSAPHPEGQVWPPWPTCPEERRSSDKLRIPLSRCQPCPPHIQGQHPPLRRQGPGVFAPPPIDQVSVVRRVLSPASPRLQAGQGQTAPNPPLEGDTGQHHAWASVPEDTCLCEPASPSPADTLFSRPAVISLSLERPSFLPHSPAACADRPPQAGPQGKGSGVL